MTITKTQLRSIITGTQQERVESLCQLLNYPVHQKDPQGSRFWYLRPANAENDAEDTCPIAVSFYPELNELTSDNEVKQFFSSDEQDKVIRGHYIKSTAENQPVMYLLFPSTDNGRTAFILPTESKLRQRSIQSFSYDDADLLARLGRLHLEQLVIANKIIEKPIAFVPQVDWIFYKPAVTAKELAEELAIVTQRIEQVIPSVYHSETEDGYLHKLLKSFQKELLPNLKLNSDDEKEYSFADIYAQTIAYGLFTARVFSYVKNPKLDFYRQGAWDKLPETNPFLRQLFKDISERKPEELGDELIDCITEAFAILRAAKMDAILADFRNKMNREDIVIRFYEDFLKAYKPRMRERRGVYYTPEPVVSYMVRSVDELIKDKFNKPLGIADPEIMILDPACGTGTFLLWIFQLIHQRYQENPEALTEGLEDKSWSGYVTERLLPRIFGFELLVAPYSICHLKLGLFLEETGYEFNSGKRLGVYLINTLEDIKLREEKEQLTLAIPHMEELIAEEAKAGSKIKKQEPIMVIIGNPPYSGISENNNEWITNLIEDYKYINGEHFRERKHWLQDDYVKFIRFSQWRIDKSGQGILAFINPHTFLDNPTFRGMRWNLLSTFNDINVLNLHGNSNRQEICPDGTPDKNVFDIRQGVSINLFIKNHIDKTELGQVKYSDLWGERDLKYNILLKQSLKTSMLKSISFSNPYYFFIDRDETGREEYEKMLLINQIFLVYSNGIVTMGDSFIIAEKKEILEDRLIDFLQKNYKEIELKNKYNLGKNYAKWIIENKKLIEQHNKLFESFIKISYRPFDIKFTIFSNKLLWRWRFETMKNMLFGNNIAFHLCRQIISDEWKHILVFDNVIDDSCISNKSKERGYTFPLYLYPDTEKPQELQQEKRANFSPEFLNKIKSKLGYLPTSEAIFYYIYAVFHSPTYRRRYAEFLKIDFPRVPLTSNKQLFTELSALGEQLVQLHLMTSPKLDKLITTFIDKGDRTVASGYPKYIDGVVMINKKEGFEGINEKVWNFYIGGYQVCHKWLKDRKGRTLSDDDILHYQKIIIVLSETIKLMTMIDETIPSFPIE